VRRLTQQVDGDQLDAAISGWLVHHTGQDPAVGQLDTAPSAIAVDGEIVAWHRAGGAGVHLLAAVTHTTGEDHSDGIVVAQRQVEQKTSEIAWFAPLLAQIDLTGRVITADALHTTRDHARYLHERGGHYVFIVKENQHRLHGQLTTLPWHEIPTCARSETGHGRSERRTIQLAPLGNYLGYPVIDFPHATHGFLIERHVTHHASGKHSTYTALGITSLPTRTGTPHPDRHLRPQPLAHRKPTALGPRRHLHRRPLPSPAQPRHQHTAPPRMEQHRHRPPPHGTQPHPTTHPAQNPHLTTQTTFADPLPGEGGGCATGRDRPVCRAARVPL